MTREIPLHNGMVALVDDEDFALASQHNWHAKKDKRTWYAATNIREGGRWKYVRLHRLLLGTEIDGLVDHWNGDGLDCRRNNLRLTDSFGNAWNRRPLIDSRSSFKGLSQRPNGKWRARITHKGVRYHLGEFQTEAEAARAYDQAARERFGEFARRNF
jgi:hypothetical protein